MFDPQPYLDKLDQLRELVRHHNTRIDYDRAGYPKLATFCATIVRPEAEPYVVLFNAPNAPGAARDRFIEWDVNARAAVRERLTIEIATLN